jgi:hypothetical protein
MGWRYHVTSRSVFSEGARAGVVGAAAVAVWFFVIDLIMGRPLYTPNVLGDALVSVLRANERFGTAGHVIVYTVFHLAMFVVIGVVAAAILRASDREPGILAGGAIFFATFEVGFFFLVYLMTKSSQLGDIAWYQIGIANIFAAALMGRMLFQSHPGVVHRANESLRGI